MNIFKITIIFFLSIFTFATCDVNIIRDFIQFNIGGHPVLHKDVTWNFDPEIGARRSRQYQELNGKFGEKAIERLGLGIDGYDQERLQKQRLRDQEHLQGATEYS